jgi:peptidoglycan hydrolase-like protein with peptidoglycan-binding domain
MQERSRFEREIAELEIDYEIPVQVVFPLPMLSDGRRPEIGSGYKKPGRSDHIGVDVMYPYDPSRDGDKKSLISAKRMEKITSRHWAHENTWVVASKSGRVIDISFNSYNGGMVLVKAVDGYQYKYLHLSDPIVKIADAVEAGQPLAQLYKNKQPIHLHLEIRKKKGEEKDPINFLKNPIYLSAIDIQKKLIGVNLYPYLADLSKAINDNKRYAKSQGWDSYLTDIYKLIELGQNPTWNDFVRAVAKWQRENGFSLEDVDGVIGPGTWAKMKKMFSTRGVKFSNISNSAAKSPLASSKLLTIPLSQELEQLPKEYDSQPTAANTTGQAILKKIYNPVIIQWVQNSLNRVLSPSPNLRTNGKWNTNTSDTLKIFQRDVGLTPDGKLNEKTISAIENKNIEIIPSNKGSKDFITWMQMALNLIYFRQGSGRCVGSYQPGGISVDGKLGSVSKTAIREFQEYNNVFGLLPTGELDEDTIIELVIASSNRPSKMNGSSLDLHVQVYQGIDWIDKVYQGTDIPISFIKGWIKKESDGQITAWTHQYDERGYMQFYPEEASNLCVDHLRLSWDWNYSFTKGLEYIRNYMKIVDKLGFDKSTDLYWRLVKLCHWTSGGVQRLVGYMTKQNFIPKVHTWNEFKKYVSDHYSEARKAAGADPNTGIENVDGTMSSAR